ncbi:MAG: Regulatory protein RecX [Candidatus Omnitrophica bacterium]|nr:Regulatory protein RecX [Candidatus Omnitrophota bacterium]
MTFRQRPKPGRDKAGLAVSEDPSVRAQSDALRLLSYRPRSRAELLKRLADKGHDRATAEAAVDKLASAGLVDDGRVARMMASAKAASAGLGRVRIAQELRRRGFAERTVSEAMSGLSPEDELSAAETLLLRRLAKMPGLAADKRRARLYGLLRRRGFGEGLIFKLFDKHLKVE